MGKILGRLVKTKAGVKLALTAKRAQNAHNRNSQRLTLAKGTVGNREGMKAQMTAGLQRMD
jgi:hypothetical protein